MLSDRLLIIMELMLPLICLAVGLRAHAIGTWLKIFDHSDSILEKQNTKVPLVGGLSVIVPFLLLCGSRLWGNPDIAFIGTLMIAVTGAFLLGFLDDRYYLSAQTRLLAAVLLLVVCLEITPAFVVTHFNFSFLGETLQVQPISLIFTVCGSRRTLPAS